MIDAKITHDRPFPVEIMQLDPELATEEEIKAFKERYEAEDLIPIRVFLEEEGLRSQREPLVKDGVYIAQNE